MSSPAKFIQHFKLPSMPTLSEIVKLYKLSAIRQLSQNFLLDKKINSKIVKSSGLKPNSFVFEIGPGPGGLTRSCIEAGAKEIVVVEKDLRFMSGLQVKNFFGDFFRKWKLIFIRIKTFFLNSNSSYQMRCIPILI
jgi:hypothetical protein